MTLWALALVIYFKISGKQVDPDQTWHSVRSDLDLLCFAEILSVQILNRVKTISS